MFLTKIHNGKKLQTHGKNLKTVHFGAHQISIPSRKYLPDPPLMQLEFFGMFFEEKKWYSFILP